MSKCFFFFLPKHCQNNYLNLLLLVISRSCLQNVFNSNWGLDYFSPVAFHSFTFHFTVINQTNLMSGCVGNTLKKLYNFVGALPIQK